MISLETRRLRAEILRACESFKSRGFYREVATPEQRLLQSLDPFQRQSLCLSQSYTTGTEVLQETQSLHCSLKTRRLRAKILRACESCSRAEVFPEKWRLPSRECSRGWYSSKRESLRGFPRDEVTPGAEACTNSETVVEQVIRDLGQQICLNHSASSELTGYIEWAGLRKFDITDCKQDKLGSQYMGKISRTVNGIPCQRWDSQSPHSHGITTVPDGSLAAADNFCRNPDNETGGPWCYTTDPNERWDYCGVPLCTVDVNDCKQDKLGTQYMGKISVTVNGRQCQRWDSQSPHSHSITTVPFGSLAASENFCRNPDGESRGPWCYTTDPNERWEYCEVPFCTVDTLDCKYDILGAGYVGEVSRTVNGIPCQRWDSQSPHSHGIATVPDDSLAAAENFCRNPDNESGGPWCYTTDPNKRWEYCGVPLCTGEIWCKPGAFGKLYTGKINITSDGKECQRWDSKSPHNHAQDGTGFLEISLAAAENYCRNPDGEPGGPWCYTTDPNQKWDYCDVPICGGDNLCDVNCYLKDSYGSRRSAFFPDGTLCSERDTDATEISMCVEGYCKAFSLA
ncbi:unnamed protein product [Owenia fusiformis]|uniref:Kringle domain-containing protein n=1 Tax=Owenia fusiformis TaxID=6347 RepID=A0A8S4PBY9_OWEFU|nr:unnamed protein product [Owenia fusiformis]